MRRRTVLLALGAAAILVALGLASRPYPRPFRFLKAYVGRSFHTAEGFVGLSGPGSGPKWFRAYAVDAPYARMRERLETALRAKGFTLELDAPRQSRWRSADRELGLTLGTENPTPWLPTAPRTPCYVQTFEPRRIPFRERVESWWRNTLRARRRPTVSVPP